MTDSSAASTLAGGATILVILALIAYTVTSKSRAVFDAEGLGFFTEKRWAPSSDTPVYGALSFIYGTAITAVDRARARRAGQPRHRPVHHPGRADRG